MSDKEYRLALVSRTQAIIKQAIADRIEYEE